jgi:hypothetical protein
MLGRAIITVDAGGGKRALDLLDIRVRVPVWE